MQRNLAMEERMLEDRIFTGRACREIDDSIGFRKGGRSCLGQSAWNDGDGCVSVELGRLRHTRWDGELSKREAARPASLDEVYLLASESTDSRAGFGLRSRVQSRG